MNFKTLAVAALAVTMLLGAVAMPAAAVSAVTVTPTDDGTGATTAHTVSFDDDTDAGDIDELTLDYEAGDLSGTDASDVTVTWATTDQPVADVEVVDDTTVTVILDEPYTLDDAAAESVDVEIEDVENPHDAGDYDVDVTIADTAAGTEFGPATGTVSVTVGETPSVTGTSALADESIVTYAADADAGDIAEVEANTDDLELRVYDDGAVIHTIDSDDDAFSVVTEATDTDPGTYEFNVTQDAYSAAELDTNDSTNVTVAVENQATDAPVNEFAVQVDNEADFSQIHMSENELANPSVLDVDAEVNEPNFIQSTLFDAENETVYEVSSERTIDGDNTTVSLFASDDDLAGDIDDTTEDAEDGDLINGLALAHDEGVALISYNERADYLDDGDTAAVYDADTGEIHLELGDEYADAESVDVTFANVPATNLERVDISSVADAYDGSELNIRALSDDLGWLDAFRVADSSFALDVPSIEWGPFGDDTDDANAFVVGQVGV